MSIDKHIARFKLLAAAAEIDPNHALTIKLFKEMLIPALRTQMMDLETLLKTLDDWYTWVIRLDHQHHNSHQAIERTKENVSKKPAPRFYFPRKERDPNAMEVDRLTFNKQTQLMKEGQCFKCRKTGHRANECLEETQDKGKK